MVRNGLQNANGQTIFGMVEIEDVFAGGAALLLLPLKQLFDFGVFDDCHALVEIKKPLNYVRQRIVIDRAVLIAQQYGRILSLFVQLYQIRSIGLESALVPTGDWIRPLGLPINLEGERGAGFTNLIAATIANHCRRVFRQRLQIIRV